MSRSINNKKYYELHKNDILKQKKEYYKLNRNSILIREKNRRDTIGRKAYFKSYYNANKTKITEYRKNNPEVQLKANLKQLKKLGLMFDMSSMQFLYVLQSWSKTIKKLDNYMCKNCDSKKDINSHHIQPKNLFPELSLSIDNGITLCKICHMETHGFELY